MNSQTRLQLDERLSRFLTSSGHFNREQNRVKPAALMPPAHGGLSVFRTANLPDVEVWKLGEVHVVPGTEGNRTLWGRADLLVASILEVGLDVDADDTPPRHANVIGWPRDKADQKLLMNLRVAETEKRIAGMVQRIVERFHPEKVMLFGSYCSYAGGTLFHVFLKQLPVAWQTSRRCTF